jgi:DNA polymerase I-like protein with 3'-5' exonuclease and polymerase domains
MHDEYGIECHESISDDIKGIMEYTMSEAGIKLNLKVPLIGEAKVGLNWKETH